MPNTNETPDLQRESMLKDIDIPGVKDRDPDPKAGPRLNVTEFRIQGLVEYPEVGITREALIKQVEEIRFDMMAEGKKLKSGYTLEELGEVSDLIASIEKETENEHVGPLEVQKLVFLIREQRRQRGITLGMIESVAETITRFYRERGFILAKAYIPKQQVRDGVVTLTILLGELGEVNVQNNKYYSSKVIQRIFKNDLAKPITNDRIEEKLFFVNDLPGLSAQGYFEPGAQVGDTKLNVNTSGERWYDANVRVDNHGSKRSGEYRLYGDFAINNPTGIGDQIQIGLLSSFLPTNSTYGSIHYNVNVLNPRVKFSIGGSTNDFVLGSGNSEATQFSSFDIEGNSVVADASLKYQITRSRVKNISTGLKFSEIKSQISIGGEHAEFLDDTVQNIELFFDFDVLNEKKRILHQGEVSIISSTFVEGADEDQATSPVILMMDYSMLTFMKVPFTNTESRLVLRGSLQYSGAALASVNQFSLAGPTRSRGYAISEYSADDAVSLSADWVFKGPGFGGAKIAGERIENIFQPFIFLDYGYGYANAYQDGAESTHAQLADAGAGIKFDFKGSARGDLTVAFPVAASNSALDEGEKPGDGVKLYFDFQYSF